MHVQQGVKTFLKFLDLRQLATVALIALCTVAVATYLTVRDIDKAQQEQILPTLNEHNSRIGELEEAYIRLDERRKLIREQRNEERDDP